MSTSFARTICGMSTYVSVVISPATTTSPVVISVSQATRPFGSSRSTESRTVSEIWSAILSGCPSVTDSEVKRNSRPMRANLLDLQERGELRHVGLTGAVDDERSQRSEVALDDRRERRARRRRVVLDQRNPVLE